MLGFVLHCKQNRSAGRGRGNREARLRRADRACACARIPCPLGLLIPAAALVALIPLALLNGLLDSETLNMDEFEEVFTRA